jgi:hypothetical protein
MTGDRVHALPVSGVHPCCQREEWDVSLLERRTGFPANVTCEGA